MGGPLHAQLVAADREVLQAPTSPGGQGRGKGEGPLSLRRSGGWKEGRGSVSWEELGGGGDADQAQGGGLGRRFTLMLFQSSCKVCREGQAPSARAAASSLVNITWTSR